MKNRYFEEFLEIAESDHVTATNLAAAYAFLLGRLEAFANYVDDQKYSISREEIAMFLGFELTNKEE